MKRNSTYKRIKRAIVNESRKINKMFNTDEWLQAGRFTTRLIGFKCYREIDGSYPITNKGIPFYFYEGYGFVELIDWQNPLNNLIIKLNAWGDDGRFKNPEDNSEIRVSYDGSGWAINSWLQYCEFGRVQDSPSHVDTYLYRNNPTIMPMTKKELEYLAKVFSEYLRLDNISEYIAGVRDILYEKITQAYSFSKRYINMNEKGELLYGILGGRKKVNAFCRDKTIDESYIFLQDPRKAKAVTLTHHKHPYNLMRSIYFKNNTELFNFIDMLDSDVKDSFELMIALKGFYRNV